MKRLAVFAVLGISLAVAPWANSSPVGGGLRGGGLKWDGGEQKPLSFKTEAGASTDFLKFKGNERACVIVVGDHDPVVTVIVEVFDANDKLVVKDDRGGDICAAIWYPPEDGLYKIRITNTGSQYNVLAVTIK